MQHASVTRNEALQLTKQDRPKVNIRLQTINYQVEGLNNRQLYEYILGRMPAVDRTTILQSIIDIVERSKIVLKKLLSIKEKEDVKGKLAIAQATIARLEREQQALVAAARIAIGRGARNRGRGNAGNNNNSLTDENLRQQGGGSLNSIAYNSPYNGRQDIYNANSNPPQANPTLPLN